MKTRPKAWHSDPRTQASEVTDLLGSTRAMPAATPRGHLPRRAGTWEPMPSLTFHKVIPSPAGTPQPSGSRPGGQGRSCLEATGFGLSSFLSAAGWSQPKQSC